MIYLFYTRLCKLVLFGASSLIWVADFFNVFVQIISNLQFLYAIYIIKVFNEAADIGKNSVSIDGDKAPLPAAPSNSDKRSWKDKVKKFVKDNKTLFIAGGVIASALLCFYFYKSFGGTHYLDDDGLDDDEEYKETPQERSQRLWRERWERESNIKDQLRPLVGPLRAQMFAPGREVFTSYVLAISKICEFYPVEYYLFNHLDRVLNAAMGNTATRSTFIRAAHCISEPEYMGQEVAARLLGKATLESPDRYLGYRVDLTFSIIAKYSSKSPDEVAYYDVDEFVALITKVMTDLRNHPAAGPALQQLHDLLIKASTYCRYW